MVEIKKYIPNGNKVKVENVKFNENVVEDVVENEYKLEIVWTSVMMNFLLHLIAIYGLFLSKQWKTIAFGL